MRTILICSAAIVLTGFAAVPLLKPGSVTGELWRPIEGNKYVVRSSHHYIEQMKRVYARQKAREARAVMQTLPVYVPMKGALGSDGGATLRRCPSVSMKWAQESDSKAPAERRLPVPMPVEEALGPERPRPTIWVRGDSTAGRIALSFARLCPGR